MVRIAILEPEEFVRDLEIRELSGIQEASIKSFDDPDAALAYCIRSFEDSDDPVILVTNHLFSGMRRTGMELVLDLKMRSLSHKPPREFKSLMVASWHTDIEPKLLDDYLEKPIQMSDLRKKVEAQMKALRQPPPATVAA